MTVFAASTAAWIHPTAIVDPGANIGDDSRLWHHCHVMTDARIGRAVMLGQGCFVGKGVIIGDGSRIQNCVSIFEGVELEAEVFVGPCATFTNVLRPRAFLKQEFSRTMVRRGATIGANATILPGVEIGQYAFVGAATLVRGNVLPHALVVGVPCRQIGWVGTHGERLRFEGDIGSCPVTGERFRLVDGGLVRWASA